MNISKLLCAEIIVNKICRNGVNEPGNNGEPIGSERNKGSTKLQPSEQNGPPPDAPARPGVPAGSGRGGPANPCSASAESRDRPGSSSPLAGRAAALRSPRPGGGGRERARRQIMHEFKCYITYLYDIYLKRLFCLSLFLSSGGQIGKKMC